MSVDAEGEGKGRQGKRESGGGDTLGNDNPQLLFPPKVSGESAIKLRHTGNSSRLNWCLDRVIIDAGGKGKGGNMRRRKGGYIRQN